MKKLIKNAFVLSMADKEPNIEKQDILIEKNRIIQLGENLSEENAEVIDANGMLVMPGIINTHTHAAMSIFRGYHDDQKLSDWLNQAIFPVEDKLEPEDIYWASYLSYIEMIKSGTTTFNDMYFMEENTVKAIEETGIRGVISWSLTDDSISDKIQQTKKFVKQYHRDENSRIRLMASAHAPYTCNPETIQLCVNLAKELKIGMHIHLAETLEEEKTIRERYGKTPTEYLRDLGVFEVPVVLAHGVYLSDSDIEILKSVKGGISHNPISNCKLSSGISRVTELRKNHILVGIGTDGIGSTTTLDMFEEMKLTAYLQKVNTRNPISIKAYDVLKMATIEGAKVIGMDHKIGSIEVGKKADLIFIDLNKTHLFPMNDICTNLVYAANGSDVDSVMIDGKMVMQNRKLLEIDENEVKKNIQKIVNRLLK